MRTVQTALGTLYWGLQDSSELQTGTLVQLLKSSLSWVQRVRTAQVALSTLYRAVCWFLRTAEQCRNSELWKQLELWYRE